MICRFTTFVFAALMASAAASPFAPAQSKNDGKAEYVSKLLRKATPTGNSQLRRLDEEYEMDLTPYSLKFMQCQFVKAYDDEMANEELGTVLATERFVTFRLCPDCDSCSYGYGEYMIGLEAYLEATTEYYQEEQEEYCQACEECGNDQAAEEDADGGRKLAAVDCDSCYATCQFYENFEELGYVDAAEYVECQQMGEAGDDGSAYFVGPICAESGAEIKIGVFTDEFCSIFAKDGTSLSDLVEAEYADENDANAAVPQLTYHNLEKVSGDSCISCLVEPEEDADANEAPEAQEVCQQLYEEAAKCETPYGFDGVLSSGDEEYANQAANEETVCTFIKAVNGGAYDEEGEISLSSSNVRSGGGSSVSGWQKFTIAALALGTLGLVGFAASLHSILTKGATADLSSKGGALA
mmetsp:Transcript_36439/g.54413  ORF Transcript_36439/g.54413 Transcript_36439/m.54413 type:complete len:411 (-) Transcript_36439:104-1336(-)